MSILKEARPDTNRRNGYRVKEVRFFQSGMGWDWEYSYHKTAEAAERRAARFLSPKEGTSDRRRIARIERAMVAKVYGEFWQQVSEAEK